MGLVGSPGFEGLVGSAGFVGFAGLVGGTGRTGLTFSGSADFFGSSGSSRVLSPEASVCFKRASTLFTDSFMV